MASTQHYDLPFTHLKNTFADACAVPGLCVLGTERIRCRLYPQEARSLVGEADVYRDDEGSLASGSVGKGTSSAAGLQGKMGLRLGGSRGRFHWGDIYGGSLRMNKAGGTSRQRELQV